MVKRAKRSERRGETLSREHIIAASIELLDQAGEDGLTFRALSQHLATGPGALYWHIANKTDLVTAACDAVLARALTATATTAPDVAIRTVALQVFDVIGQHPWVGSALTGVPGLSPIVRILERIGEQVRIFGIPDDQQWEAVGTLMAYILGVSRQNAANGQLARIRGLDRSEFLEAVSASWSQLNPQTYPFTRSLASKLRDHEDRADFSAGIDLILEGIHARQRRERSRSSKR